MRSMIKNKRAIEGLPLKYIIVILVAAIVIAIAVQMTGIVGSGITGSSTQIAAQTGQMVNQSLLNANASLN